MLDTNNDISTKNQEYLETHANELQELTDNLYAFYSVFVSSRFEDDCEAPHIKTLAKYLMDITNGNSKKNRLCVAMPPQHSKSSLVTLAYSVWLIVNNPNLRILIVNAEKELSTEFGIDIRNLIQEMGAIYGLTVSRVKSSATNLKFNLFGKLQTGSIRLTGASGSITGHPADIVIVDDPYKGLSDELTPTALRKKWLWYTSLIEQRVRKNTKLVILHTRWHSEDIQGMIKSDEYQRLKYDFVEFPAIDENNNPLWPEYYDLEFYQDKQRTMGERQFQAIYQQQPLDLTGDFFYVDNLIFEDRFDDYPIARCRSWDIAASDDSLGDQRDYTAGVRMLKTPNDEYWIFDVERGQYGNDLKNVLSNTAKRDSPQYTILIETGAGNSDLLFDEYKGALTGFNVQQSKTKGATKMDRATPLANAIYDGKVHVCINNNNMREVVLSELKAFPNGKHDDCVDALAYGFNWLKAHGDNQVKTGGQRKRSRI